ncbi:MAG: glycoside hydrolase family 31 protein [Micropruina sp.]|uniref:glycoside hydrolase family 31 protein n=1 Tax=Micropruina sp. TaxID=2737536 RepID=UPI0039E6DC07
MARFLTDGSILTWTGDGETIRVEPWGANSLRVRAALSGEIADTDWALLPADADASGVAVDVQDDTATIRNGGIVAILRARSFDDEGVGYLRHTCSIEYRDGEGKLLLRELGDGGALKLRARHYDPRPSGPYRLTAAFEASPGEKLYGMGQYQQDILDIKGCTFELAHRNSQASVPFLMSNLGYGFLWHNPAVGRATFGRNRTEWVAESTQQLDYWITAGSTPHAIVSAYADVTGHVPMMPEYGLGYWQCKLRYWNQDQVLDVAREHQRRGIPLDVLVIDFFHWPTMGDYRFEDEFWPDPAAMAKELGELGVTLMVSVWPQVSVDSENFEEFSGRNCLVRSERGSAIQMSYQGPSMFLDVTHPDARQRLWELCRQNYWDQGVRAFWLDVAEPEFGLYDFEQYRYHTGPVLQVGNLYPQLYSRTFYEGMRSAGQDEVVNLVRCAWAGSQRYGALVWSGDIHSTFDDLRAQVVAGIHMGIAGIPWFTTDIGGFHGGDVRDPEFHELLLRWFQFGVFSPVMRMHGHRQPFEQIQASDGTARLASGAPNELWSYGAELGETLAGYVRMREALRPYTRSLMRDAHTDGQPVLRGLFHEFPDDPRTWDVADQFLFGPDLLVAPVLDAGARARSVYLPRGASWTNVWTGEVHQGGQEIAVDAPMDVIPVFARDAGGQELRTYLTSRAPSTASMIASASASPLK